jgi:hypothetical protein
MGRSVSCGVTVGTRHFNAQVELETDEIIVRGPEGFRLKFDKIRPSVKVAKGVLKAEDQKREVAFELGLKEAALWLEKIRHPPSRLDKLGIKSKTRVGLVGDLPKDLADEIAATGAVLVQGGKVDFVLFEAKTRRDLDQLDTLREWIAPDAGIWVLRRKGSETIHERDIHAAAKVHKLVAVKVARMSEHHGADKLAIPRRDR